MLTFADAQHLPIRVGCQTPDVRVQIFVIGKFNNFGQIIPFDFGSD